MKPFATCDVETDPFKYGRPPKPFVADFFDGKKHYVVWDEKCIEKLAERMMNYEGIIYAHNGGKFDWHFFLPFVQVNVEIFCIRNRFADLHLGDSRLQDSFLFIPSKLSNFAGKKDIDIGKLEAKVRDKHRAEIIQYLKSDTEQLHVSIDAFQKEFGRGMTIRNRAFSEMRKFGYKPIRGNQFFDEKFRKFFYGGRCQCFVGKGDYKESFTNLDVNSAYPAAMMEEHIYGLSLDESDVKSPIRGQDFVTLKCRSKGCFPVREKDGIKFPEIFSEFHVTGWEYLAAKEHGLFDEEEIIDVYRPQELKSFAPFISHYYARKLAAEKRGDKMQREFSKLFMNSGFGGFAMNPDDFKDHMICDAVTRPKGEEWQPLMRTVTGQIVWEKQSDKKRYFNVLTAASITGWQRANLMRALAQVDEPYYCDTDSIIFKGKHALKLGDGLGEWKIEAKWKRFVLAGKKLYAGQDTKGKWKVASKGFRCDEKFIIDLLKVKEKIVELDAPIFSCKTGMRFMARKIKATA